MAADEELAKIQSDSAVFLASLVDLEATGHASTVKLASGLSTMALDGSSGVGRLPLAAWRRSIPHCLGHRYAEFPEAAPWVCHARSTCCFLRQRSKGCDVEITTDREHRVATCHRGHCWQTGERFTKPEQFGGTAGALIYMNAPNPVVDGPIPGINSANGGAIADDLITASAAAGSSSVDNP